MHKSLKSFASCTGCMACVNSCPLGCIDICEHKDGFFYPLVDETRCVGCGKCAQVCRNKLCGDVPLNAVACYNANENERLEGSSGGIFYLLAKEIVNNNGVVYGAAFKENFLVEHKRVDKLVDLKQLLGSKYVQSYIGNVYKLVKKDLSEGREVLFSGTPCQIFALKSFLGEPYTKLVCVEVICHGVPSPGVWNKYFRHIEHRCDDTIHKVNFRDKSMGWHNFSLGIYGKTNQLVEPSNINLYMRLFLGNHILRQSCYHCEHATIKRNADITLGDCWGNEKICPQMSPNGGISVVILNTEKGVAFYEKIKDKIVYENVSLKEVIRNNKSFLTSPAQSAIRKTICSVIEMPVDTWGVEETKKDKLFSVLKRIYNKIWIEITLFFKLNRKN